jgi:uncharacterized protein YdeI (YjbR/CyaY-like superfamily)
VRGQIVIVPEARRFAAAQDFRAWLARHHADTPELHVRLFRTSAADRGLTYREALDEALCYGWIDGVRRSLDDVSFTQRFSPRRPTSVWSRINIARAKALIAEGRMAPPGLAAFEARDPKRSGVYSFERDRPAVLDPALARKLRANAAAWKYFNAQPPWYRRTCTHWIMSARREDTRARRLATLIDCSAGGRAIPPLARSIVSHSIDTGSDP